MQQPNGDIKWWGIVFVIRCVRASLILRVYEFERKRKNCRSYNGSWRYATNMRPPAMSRDAEQGKGTLKGGYRCRFIDLQRATDNIRLIIGAIARPAHLYRPEVRLMTSLHERRRPSCLLGYLRAASPLLTSSFILRSKRKRNET